VIGVSFLSKEKAKNHNQRTPGDVADWKSGKTLQ